MPLSETALWALVVLGVVALCVWAWHSRQLNRSIRQLAATWHVKVEADARYSEVTQERERQALHLQSETMGERVTLERAELAHRTAVVNKQTKQELYTDDLRLKEEQQQIDAALKESVAPRHAATLQDLDRPRPTSTGTPGRHFRDQPSADAPTSPAAAVN